MARVTRAIVLFGIYQKSACLLRVGRSRSLLGVSNTSLNKFSIVISTRRKETKYDVATSKWARDF